MRKITKKELKEILRRHELWSTNTPGGERADLSGVNLHRMDLRFANLAGANLTGAKLTYADLKNADLSEADLAGAYLCKADLRGADVTSANLTGASLINASLVGAMLTWSNLTNADLRGVDFRGANLRSVNFCGADLKRANFWEANLYKANLKKAFDCRIPIACPEEGQFIGFKKVRIEGGESYIVKLQIPAKAKRCSATSRKCRCEYAKVLSITNLDGSKTNLKCIRNMVHPCTYTVGEIVRPDSFDENRFNECSHGIHFFITRQEAVDY